MACSPTAASPAYRGSTTYAVLEPAKGPGLVHRIQSPTHRRRAHAHTVREGERDSGRTSVAAAASPALGWPTSVGWNGDPGPGRTGRMTTRSSTRIRAMRMIDHRFPRARHPVHPRPHPSPARRCTTSRSRAPSRASSRTTPRRDLLRPPRDVVSELDLPLLQEPQLRYRRPLDRGPPHHSSCSRSVVPGATTAAASRARPTMACAGGR